MNPNITDLETEISFKTSRSGGSGGQHVNKVSTKVELDFDIAASKILTDEQKAVLLQKLSSRLTTEGILQIIAQAERSQLRNKKAAIEKFYTLITEAFVVQKKRKPTKISKAAKERRLVSKKRKAEVKKLRRNEY